MTREYNRAKKADQSNPDVMNLARLHEIENVKNVIEGILKMKPTFIFEKLQPDAILPQKAHKTDAGWDVRSSEMICLHPNTPEMVPTALRCNIPDGWEIQVRSRSGLASKGIFVLNSPGTIDSGYRGEIKVILMNTTPNPVIVNKGDKIAQLIFCPVYDISLEEGSVLTNTDRKDGGFGSTGK